MTVLCEYRLYKDIMQRLTERDPQNTAWLRELSVSHICLGRGHEAQDRLVEALGEYEISKQITQRLTCAT